MAEFIPTGIGGFATRTTVKRSTIQNRPETGAYAYERKDLLPPPRPLKDYIPTQDVIDALVQRALAAIAKGIYWDRGSIINIVL